jgi:hypothetical protein
VATPISDEELASIAERASRTASQRGGGGTNGGGDDEAA